MSDDMRGREILHLSDGFLDFGAVAFVRFVPVHANLERPMDAEVHFLGGQSVRIGLTQKERDAFLALLLKRSRPLIE